MVGIRFRIGMRFYVTLIGSAISFLIGSSGRRHPRLPFTFEIEASGSGESDRLSNTIHIGSDRPGIRF
jgi:hypothetical protein